MPDTPATKLAQHIMMVLAHNTPNGPVEYAKCLKVITAIIEKHQQPSVPVSIIKDLRRQCYDIATAKIPKEQSKFGKGFEAGNTAAYSDFVDELDALIHQAEKLKEQEKQP